MSVTGVNSTTPTTPTTSTPPTNALGENDFLNLLVTEMKNQDPDNAMDDTQFVSELAQFSSLQATTSVATDQQNTQAVGMIGSTVSYPNPADTTSTTSLSGQVTSVTFNSSGTGPTLAVTDSSGNVSQVPLSSVTSVQ